jgi:hypothetical protein
MVYMYHGLLIPSPTDEQVGYTHVLAIACRVAWDMGMKSLQHMVPFPLVTSPVV